MGHGVVGERWDEGSPPLRWNSDGCLAQLRARLSIVGSRSRGSPVTGADPVSVHMLRSTMFSPSENLSLAATFCRSAAAMSDNRLIIKNNRNMTFF